MIRVSCHPHAVTDAKGVTRTYWRAAWRDGIRLAHAPIAEHLADPRGDIHNYRW